MTTMDQLYKLVQSHNIKNALIIDDAYDSVPLAEDLQLGDIDSITYDLARSSKAVKKTLGALLESNALDRDDYVEGMNNDNFIAKLWDLANSKKISKELRAKLFTSYEADQESKRSQLVFLEELLKTDLKITYKSQGRTLGKDPIDEFQIIFLDLYLGVTDKKTAIDQAIERIRVLLENSSDERRPLIIVMSTSGSTQLQELASDLQSRAELLGCKFRAVNKEDFPESLPKALGDLLTHWNDAQAVAKWIDAWSLAIRTSAKDCVRGMRLLDLSDLAYLIKFRLEKDSTTLGKYLNAMSSSYVQSCIEKHLATSRDDRLLDGLKFDKFPPVHFLPSAQIPRLKHASSFLNDAVIDSVGLRFDNAMSVLDLGDLIVAKPKNWKPGSDLEIDDMPAFVVISQACDIAQKKSDTILLLRGLIRRRDWTAALNNSPETTDVFIHKDQQFLIEWKKAQITAWPANLANRRLAENHGDYLRIGRFREVEALKLQQIFASNLTRVGTLAAPHPHIDVGLVLTAPKDGGGFEKIFEFTPVQRMAAVMDVRPLKGDIYQYLVFNSDMAEKVASGLQDPDLSGVKAAFAAQIKSIAKSPEKLSAFDRATKLKDGIDFGGGLKIATIWNRKLGMAQLAQGQKEERESKLVLAITTKDETSS
jgi:hypothetical protein